MEIKETHTHTHKAVKDSSLKQKTVHQQQALMALCFAYS